MATEKRPEAFTATSSPLPGQAGLWYQEVAQEGIETVCQHVASAWSRGDIPALALALASDCDHMTLTRVRQIKRGSEEILDSWIQAFARRCPAFSIRMSVKLLGVRLVREDLALVDGCLEYSSGIGAGGVAQGRSSQPFAAVMSRSDTTWVILSLRVGAATAAPKVINFVESSLQR
jgi:hypothetical protein